MYEALFLPQNLSLETSVDNGLQTETKTIMPALGLPIVRISHRRGSLIPLPLSERREAIKKARVYIPVSYGIYTLLKFS